MQIIVGTEKGWTDLVATQRNVCADLYDRLQADPTHVDNPNKQHQLKRNWPPLPSPDDSSRSGSTS